jgi:hypothetical protein
MMILIYTCSVSPCNARLSVTKVRKDEPSKGFFAATSVVMTENTKGITLNATAKSAGAWSISFVD